MDELWGSLQRDSNNNELLIINLATVPAEGILIPVLHKCVTVACKLMRQSLIIISLFLTSCFSSYNDKQKVDKDNVNYVEIRKQFDTVSLRLTTDQVVDFIDNWNSSSPKGPYKYLPEYF